RNLPRPPHEDVEAEGGDEKIGERLQHEDEEWIGEDQGQGDYHRGHHHERGPLPRTGVGQDGQAHPYTFSISFFPMSPVGRTARMRRMTRKVMPSLRFELMMPKSCSRRPMTRPPMRMPMGFSSPPKIAAAKALMPGTVPM